MPFNKRKTDVTWYHLNCCLKQGVVQNHKQSTNTIESKPFGTTSFAYAAPNEWSLLPETYKLQRIE